MMDTLNRFFVATSLLALLAAGGCAGRDAHPVTVSQANDAVASCAALTSEIQANERKIDSLDTEKGLKVAQNVGAVAAGFFTFGLGWAAMDWKGAAWEEQEALEERNRYLSGVYQDRCTKTTADHARTPVASATPAPEKIYQ